MQRTLQRRSLRARDVVRAERCLGWPVLFAVSAAGYGGIWRDTGRYREIPGDTRGYDEIRSPHDVFTTTSVKLIGRDGRNFALRPAVICRAAKRSIPMIGESSSSSMKHRKDSLDRRPGGWSPAAGGLSRSGGSGGPGWAARGRTGIRRSRGRRSMLALCGRSAERPGCSA